MAHMQAAVPLVVFSDLDGTLLDHETYDWTPAQPAIRALAEIGAPLILASSKTATEITALQDSMGLAGLPAIVENGAGVIGLADDDTKADEYGRLRALLDGLPQTLRQLFIGFGDMSLEQVIDATGLDPDAARAARDRAFSEPGLWQGTEAQKEALIAAISEHGLSARQGGRFLTLSFGRTKADGMTKVMQHYDAAQSIALGDAPNDVEMLEAADIGVVIANPAHTPLPPLAGEADGKIIRTKVAGPAGWNRAILKLTHR